MPQTVTANDKNSSKRMVLKCIGASQPGNEGIRMIAVICGTHDLAGKTLLIYASNKTVLVTASEPMIYSIRCMQCGAACAYSLMIKCRFNIEHNIKLKAMNSVK